MNRVGRRIVADIIKVSILSLPAQNPYPNGWPEEQVLFANGKYEANQYVLDGANINQWTDNSPALNHFLPVSGIAARAIVDANGNAVFGTGDVLQAANYLAVTNQLSVFVRIKPNTATITGTQLIIGSHQPDTNKRSWAIYNLVGDATSPAGYIAFLVTNSGLAGVTDSKIYRIPYTTLEQAIGFVFNAGTLTIYKNGAIVTPTKPNDAAITTMFNNNIKMTIGYPLTGAGAINSGWMAPDYTIKKIGIKLGVATAEERASI